MSFIIFDRSVFDVTKGKSHYGSGGGYNHFAGRHVLKSVPHQIMFLFCLDSYEVFPFQLMLTVFLGVCVIISGMLLVRLSLEISQVKELFIWG